MRVISRRPQGAPGEHSLCCEPPREAGAVMTPACRCGHQGTERLGAARSPVDTEWWRPCLTGWAGPTPVPQGRRGTAVCPGRAPGGGPGNADSGFFSRGPCLGQLPSSPQPLRALSTFEQLPFRVRATALGLPPAAREPESERGPTACPHSARRLLRAALSLVLA